MINILALLIGLAIVVGTAFCVYTFHWKALLIIIPLLALAAFFPGGGMDFPDFAAPALIGSAGGFAYRSEKDFTFFMLVSTFMLTGLFTGHYYYLLLHRQVDLLLIEKSQMAGILTALGAPDDFKTQILSDIEMALPVIRDLNPFRFFINSIIVSGLCFMALNLFFTVLRRMKIKGLEFFRMNDYLIFVLIAGWSAFLLIDKNEYHPLYVTGINIALVTSVLYLIQAFGIIKFFIIKRGLPGGLVFLLLLFMLSTGIWFVFIAVMLTGLGALDLWADFRKINPVKKRNEE